MVAGLCLICLLAFMQLAHSASKNVQVVFAASEAQAVACLQEFVWGTS